MAASVASKPASALTAPPKVPPRPNLAKLQSIKQTSTSNGSSSSNEGVPDIPAFTTEEELDMACKSITAKTISECEKDLQAEMEIQSRQLPLIRFKHGRALCLSTIEREHAFRGCEILEKFNDNAGSQSKMTPQMAQMIHDSLLLMAIARFHVGEYRNARLLCETYIRRGTEENTKQGKILHKIIRDKVYREGLSGYGVALLVVIATTIVCSAIGSRGGGRR